MRVGPRAGLARVDTLGLSRTSCGGALALLLVALVMGLAGCARPDVHRQESYVFGTRVEVQIWGGEATAARAAMAEVLAEFDRLHHLLHAWQPSPLTALNVALARGEPHRVPAELARLLGDARQIAVAGEQLFNPAIGRLIALWGFHADEFQARRPEAVALAGLVQARPRMSDLVIEGETVSSSNPAVQIDLGGYAKGYALDRAAALLRARGLGDALINIGGNVMALGSKGGKPWRVGIQHPRAPAPLATLDLRDGEAIGTSGDYQRYFELDGRRYCHLIDPERGEPAQHTQAVTVLIAPGPRAGTLSDAASKPLFLAGATRWLALARRLEVRQALRVDADGRIAVTRPMYQRLRFEPGIATPELVD